MADEYFFDGYISYMFSAYVDFDRNLNPQKRLKQLISNIKEKYSLVILDSDAEAQEDPILSDIRLAQNFLHGTGLPFDCTRLMIRDYQLKLPDFPVTGVGVLLSIFPEFNTVQVFFYFKADQVTTDQLIYLRHIFGGVVPFRNEADGSSGSLTDYFHAIASSFGIPVRNIEQMYLLELRKIWPDNDYVSFMKNESKRIYGMICGDEGWQFVPEELAKERLSNSWGSREFVQFFAFGNNALLFNMIDSEDGKNYQKRQTEFGNWAYGGAHDYFFLKSEAAGVNHGIFFGQETVMVIKTIAANIMERQASRKLSRRFSLRDDLRLTKEFRAELITTINKVEDLGISEIGELEQMLLTNFKISPLIESIKYLLEMLDADLDLLYQQDTNKKVNLLTVVGLLISGIDLILTIIFTYIL